MRGNLERLQTSLSFIGARCHLPALNPDTQGRFPCHLSLSLSFTPPHLFSSHRSTHALFCSCCSIVAMLTSGSAFGVAFALQFGEFSLRSRSTCFPSLSSLLPPAVFNDDLFTKITANRTIYDENYNNNMHHRSYTRSANNCDSVAAPPKTRLLTVLVSVLRFPLCRSDFYRQPFPPTFLSHPALCREDF